MACPPVRGDNPRALASGLSYVQVDIHGKTNICVDLAHQVIFHANVGKGGINFEFQPYEHNNYLNQLKTSSVVCRILDLKLYFVCRLFMRNSL